MGKYLVTNIKANQRINFAEFTKKYTSTFLMAKEKWVEPK